jgi:hypothetical protein
MSYTFLQNYFKIQAGMATIDDQTQPSTLMKIFLDI